MIRRIFSSFVIIAALVVTLGVSSASAQTTYTQTNHVCLLYECTLSAPAEFNPPALLSYFLPSVFNQLNQGKTNITFIGQYAYWCAGSFTCTQTEYTDFSGTLVRTYHGIDPNCPISVSCWELKGTFNAGQNAVDEKWQCSRSCGSNASGSVVVQ